jgi:hypothetical protein
MRSGTFLVLVVEAALACFGQAAAGEKPNLPNDPQAILAMAAPFYDFSNPALTPWHLTATYQLCDYTLLIASSRTTSCFVLSSPGAQAGIYFFTTRS